MSEPTITIDLGKATGAYVIDETATNLIQHEAVSLFLDLLKTHLEKAKKSNSIEKNKLHYERHHNTIMIDGERGTGKTTFILNMIAAIKAGKDDLDKEIWPLRIVDPTLMDSKEHILLTFIMLIKKAVELEIKNKDIDTQSWKKSVDILAKGVCMLDGIGRENFKSELWNDYQSIMEDGLIETEHCFNLEVNLHNFLHESLTLINKKAFLLAFDDIDTNFKSGMPVLETLRKYLTSPKLITVLSGDIELYSNLIHKSQFENFTKDYVEFRSESTANQKIEKTIERLEEQYIQKILQPGNRISLKSTSNCITSQRKILIQHPGDPNGEFKDEIVNVAKTICEKTFNLRSQKQIQQAQSALLNCPVRTTINLISTISECYSPKWEALPPSEEISKKTNRALANTFISALLRAGYSASEIQDQSISPIWKKLLNKSIESGSISRCTDFTPGYITPGENQAALTLNHYYSSSIAKNPHYLFTYIIEVGLAKIAEEEALQKHGEKPITGELKAYCEFSLLTPHDSAATSAQKAITFLRSPILSKKSKFDTTPVSIGSICIYADSMKGRIRKEWITLLSQNLEIDENMLTTPSRLKKDTLLFGLHLPIWAINRATRERTPYASIFPLLGIIAEILAQDDSKKSTKWESTEELIREMDSIQEVMAPGAELDNKSSKKSPAKKDIDPIFDDAYANTGSVTSKSIKKYLSSLQSMSERMEAWKVEFNKTWKSNPLPIHIVDKFFNKFKVALARMDDEFRNTNTLVKRGLGNLLHLQISAFINSMLVEEYYFRQPHSDVRLSLRNPITTDDIIIENLDKLSNLKSISSASIPITILLLKCPLLRIYTTDALDYMSVKTGKELEDMNVVKDLDRLIYQPTHSFNKTHEPLDAE